MPAIRGILRWILPWHANSAEVVHPHNPDAVPASRRINLVAREYVSGPTVRTTTLMHKGRTPGLSR